MRKLILLFSTVALLALSVSACAPVSITKTYQERYTDPTTGKEIIYTESIQQVPEKRMPIHLKHPELYE